MHMVVMVTICGTSNYVAGVQVNFLGTGSAEPSKYRGASAIHIRSLTPYPPPLFTCAIKSWHELDQFSVWKRNS